MSHSKLVHESLLKVLKLFRILVRGKAALPGEHTRHGGQALGVAPEVRVLMASELVRSVRFPFLLLSSWGLSRRWFRAGFGALGDLSGIDAPLVVPISERARELRLGRDSGP